MQKTADASKNQPQAKVDNESIQSPNKEADANQNSEEKSTYNVNGVKEKVVLVKSQLLEYTVFLIEVACQYPTKLMLVNITEKL